MPAVTVPAEFFRGELRVYADWREAFARELLQNAVDAGAGRIDIRISQNSGQVVVSIHDNGHGMDRHTLEHVFFALGRTTKDSTDAVGGYGRARIITCFAQRSYRIRTGTLEVTGTGGNFEIVDGHDHQPGCRFDITLIDDQPAAVAAAFEQLLHRCWLPASVTLNGRHLHQRSLPSRARRVLRDEQNHPWAKVYVEADSGGRLQVRVNGLLMFTRRLAASNTVTVELDPTCARSVLAASRDRLVGRYDDQLDEFTAELASDWRRALRSARQPIRRRVGGGTILSADVPDHQPDGRPAQVAADVDRAEAAPAPAARTAGRTQEGVAAQQQPAATSPQLGLVGWHGPDVFLFADDAGARERRLLRLWDPTRWDATTGTRRRALLRGWQAACQQAIDQLLLLRPQLAPLPWTVGWTLDTGVEADHRTVAGVHVLALNPVDAAGRIRFALSRHSHRWALQVLALHEAAHVAVDTHDERWGGLLTDLTAALVPTAAAQRIDLARRSS